ncbi:MAG: 1,2-epoxyphenylacetyl-CoA isomerase [Gammaproteobacteria bacterium]|nr:1,2-epoxyphenylacetyl-CoA isomerase [Gammaproteobacteria bacterium]
MTSVLTKIDKGVAVVTLNRPDVLNALSPDMARTLHHVLVGISEDENVRCVVLKGAGNGFMAGGDVGFFKSVLPDLDAGKVDELDPVFKHVHGIVATLRTMTVPVIGVLHGAVAGFGVSLAVACDLVVAAEETQFTLAYCHIGTSPDGASTYFLPRIVGFKKAMELALLGNRFDAREALALGILNKVVPATDLEASVNEWVRRLLSGPKFAYGKTKALLYSSLDNSFDRQIELEEESFKHCARTRDFAEGVTAFVEKRKAEFG